MNRMLKIVLSLCCLIGVAASLGSCGVGALPGEETVQKDFENYLNYYGELPFTYNFKSFEVKDEVANNEDKTGIVTIEASVERLYGSEIYNDITYVADIHYAKIDGEWNHEYVVVKSSSVAKGFDLESVFFETVWAYNEETSRTESEDMEKQGLPVELQFNGVWDKDMLNVVLKFSGDSETGLNAAFRGMEAYVEQYGDIGEWDFRIVYVLDSGAVLDFVHISGELNNTENWVIGYRESTAKERSLVFYKLEPVEE